LLSQNSNSKPPQGFIDKPFESGFAAPKEMKVTVAPSMQLTGDSQVYYQRAKLLKAPKASEVPFI